MRLRHHLGARLDVLEIVEYYEKNADSAVVGEFYAELLRCFERILDHPRSFRIVEDNMRRANLDRFPHNVIFEIVNSTTIRTLAIRHNSRDPRYGFDRN